MFIYRRNRHRGWVGQVGVNCLLQPKIELVNWVGLQIFSS
ncbi:Uncharacterised protein [Vibrio cholerae]|nr:Uncharacterised protein [Vibrio cholerae]CSC54527.1 Uncharacterised protein [Vibrio cholerae]